MSEPMISNDSFSVLKQLYDGIALSEPYPDAQLRQLSDASLAVYQINNHEDYSALDIELAPDPVHEIRITEFGKAFVEWRERETDLKEGFRQAAADIAASFKEQVDSAKADARGAKIRSWVAIVISVAALILQYVVPLVIGLITARA